MKSEERHQLLSNDLEAVTTKTVGVLERHAATIAAVVCGVLLVAAVGFWWTQSAESENAAGWTMLGAARDAQELDNVVGKFKGTPPAQWAKLRIAEKTLQDAIPLMFTNRELALTDLKSASGDFETLAKEKGINSSIRERALWGFAQCLEVSCDGDTARPIAAYAQLVADYPETIFKAVAEERMISLKKSGAADFYKWFAKEAPKPPEARPRDFNPHGITLPAPADPKDEMDEDDAEKPKDPAAGTPPAATNSGENAQEPPKAETKPEVDKPVEATKPADKPSDGEKPPATDPPKDGEKPSEKN